jgi:predicted tellurium resistance membrane protein TerC
MLDVFLTPEALIAVATLTFLEIVLGIDNIVFIAITTSRLPREQQPLARRLGLALALLTRLGLLFTLSWIMTLDKPLFTALGFEMTGRGLILFAGGIFLIWKAAHEIYLKTEGDEEEHEAAAKAGTFGLVLVQIAILDIIFSLDSIITAVGMVNELPLMVTAIVIAIIVMIIFADPVSEFVNTHPSIKILALAFLLLIGVMLTAEGTGRAHVEKGYIYFAMGFSIFVEIINMRYRRNRKPKPETSAAG